MPGTISTNGTTPVIPRPIPYLVGMSLPITAWVPVSRYSSGHTHASNVQGANRSRDGTMRVRPSKCITPSATNGIGSLEVEAALEGDEFGRGQTLTAAAISPRTTAQATSSPVQRTMLGLAGRDANVPRNA